MVSAINGSSNDVKDLMLQLMQSMQTANTDGVKGLSKEELSSIDTGENKIGAKFIETLKDKFDQIDTNQDGQITENEVQALSRKPMGPPPGMFDELFSNDTDGVSGLSLDELASVDAGADEGTSKFVDNLKDNFETFDKDKNGQISMDEMTSFTPGGNNLNQNANNGESSAGNSLKSAFSEFLLKQLSGAYQGKLSDIASSLSLAI